MMSLTHIATQSGYPIAVPDKMQKNKFEKKISAAKQEEETDAE